MWALFLHQICTFVLINAGTLADLDKMCFFLACKLKKCRLCIEKTASYAKFQ